MLRVEREGAEGLDAMSGPLLLQDCQQDWQHEICTGPHTPPHATAGSPPAATTLALPTGLLPAM